MPHYRSGSRGRRHEDFHGSFPVRIERGEDGPTYTLHGRTEPLPSYYEQMGLPERDPSGPRRRRRRRHASRPPMPTIDERTVGDPCRTRTEFRRVFETLPAAELPFFREASREMKALAGDVRSLHVYEVRGSIDELLNVAAVLEECRAPGAHGGCVLVVGDAAADADNVLEMVRWATGEDGAEYVGGAVVRFGTVSVLVNRAASRAFAAIPGYTADGGRGEWHQAQWECVARLDEIIRQTHERVGTSSVVYHGGEDPSFLGFFLAGIVQHAVACDVRAVTLTAVLAMNDDGVDLRPSSDRAAVAAIVDMCGRLGARLLFVDAVTMGLEGKWDSLACVPEFSTSWPMLLPEGISRRAAHAAWDAATLSVFLLRAVAFPSDASGRSLARSCLARLDPATARVWAKECISPAAYDAPVGRGPVPALEEAARAFDAPLFGASHGLAKMMVGAGRNVAHAAAVRVRLAPGSFRALAVARESHVHVLFPTSRRECVGDLGDAWVEFLHRRRGAHEYPGPDVPRDLALAWQRLQLGVLPVLREIMGTSRFRGWTEELRGAVRLAEGRCSEGQMTRLARRALGHSEAGWEA